MNHAAKYLLVLLFLAAGAMADTVTVPCANYSCTIPMAVQPTGNISVVLHAYDADGPTQEGTLRVGTECGIPLWGTYANAANNLTWTDAGPYTLPATCLGIGSNAVLGVWNSAGTYKHDFDRITVTFTATPPPTNETWMVALTALHDAGWVPDWFSLDDNVWAIPREDIDPARTIICMADRQSTAKFATWVEGTLETLPSGPAPAASQCALAWCNALGPTREAAIDAACP